MNKAEKHLHQQICSYLNLQYPDVIYLSDPSGLKVSIGVAIELKKKRCKKYKIPDLIILKPMNGLHGLVLEIKVSVDDVFTKKMEIRTNEHIQEQHKTIRELVRLGYAAYFGIGFEGCKRLIDNYLKVGCVIQEQLIQKEMDKWDEENRGKSLKAAIEVSTITFD